ncbi:MAG: aminodeoxychorismate synthase component I [Cocleimonas sp.]|nr:aminodeoxychorismate synthase component I [Cocleimonas sp.]
MNQLVKLPYFENSSQLFSCIARDHWSIFLDSGFPSENAGRYDILVAEPVTTITTHNHITTVKTQTEQCKYQHSPFDVLRSALKDHRPQQDKNNSLPFNGGALGYFGYDLARTIEKIPCIAKDAEQLPEMAIGIYTWAVVVDHHLKKSYLTGHLARQQSKFSWEGLIALFSQTSDADLKKTTPHHSASFHVTSAIRSNLSYQDYKTAFQNIKKFIMAGDCYQINLTQRFSASAKGNSWIAYQQLRRLNSAPFSAYINTPFGEILSSSPERFLRLDKQNKVETNPIKGTCPRLSDTKKDHQQQQQLRSSQKDKAENVMIVDLLRNDLGRVCKKGSLHVPKLFELESYATVHHLVSTIKGVLEHHHDAISLLKACFPGGSITGAPKIRAMEIIESLEPHRRGVYCGSIGYIDFNGHMDTNIAIRTLVYNQKTIRFWVGGGIVHDSTIDEEYQETLDKGKALLALLKNCQIKSF